MQVRLFQKHVRFIILAPSLGPSADKNSASLEAHSSPTYSAGRTQCADAPQKHRAVPLTLGSMVHAVRDTLPANAAFSGNPGCAACVRRGRGSRNARAGAARYSVGEERVGGAMRRRVIGHYVWLRCLRHDTDVEYGHAQR